jgi:hypothetical protein
MTRLPKNSEDLAFHIGFSTALTIIIAATTTLLWPP